MQIILLEKVVNLGQLGDVVKVKQGLRAQLPDPAGQGAPRDRDGDQGIRDAPRRSRKSAAGQARRPRKRSARSSAARPCRSPAKAGVDGRLFGSVTNFDIAEALGKQGFEVDKGQIRMPQGPLKAVGEHHVSVALHTDVVADITVTVLGEQG